MKILQLFNRFPWPLKDGGALGYYNWLYGYSAAGCNVTAAVLNTSKHYIDFNSLPQEVKNLADYHLVDIDNSLKIKDAFFNLFTNESYHVSRFISKEFEQLLIKLCQENTFDVVVFESIFTAPYLDIIKKNSSAKCVIRAHNVEYQIWETQAGIEKNPIKKWYLNLLSKRLKHFELSALKQFDGILAITDEDQQVFALNGINVPFHIAPAGLNLDRFARFEPKVTSGVFHLGSMDWMPNQEAIMWFVNEVWPKITNKFPDEVFYIAGRNMPESFYNIKTPGVKVIGEVEDACSFMNQHAIMIVPLFSGSGMRVKILEGMAMGKCIIATSLGAQGIKVTNGKDILLANTANEFIETLLYLMSHRDKLTSTGLSAKQTAFSLYDNKQVVNKTLGFYKRLINNEF